jgi:predicted CxxxxCH...CXXCH cytochrome family protein
MRHSLRGAAFALPVFVAILSFGCSSGSSSPGTSSTTFTEVYTTVLAKNCTNSTCHFSGAGSVSVLGALDMSSQPTAYMNLVNVKAAGVKCGTSGLTRVVPNDPSSSLMYEKVHDTVPPCGAQMPYLLPALPADEQSLIFDWINGGAQND